MGERFFLVVLYQLSALGMVSSKVSEALLQDCPRKIELSGAICPTGGPLSRLWCEGGIQQSLTRRLAEEIRPNLGGLPTHAWEDPPT